MKLRRVFSKQVSPCPLVLCSALALGFADSVCAQGFIYFGTYYNTSPSPTATSNGQWWLSNSHGYGGGPSLLNQDVNAELWGSATGQPGTFTVVAKLLLADGTARGDITGNWPGGFADPNLNVYRVPGATTTSAWFYLQAWLGNATTLQGAWASGQANYDGEWNGLFQNPTGLTPATAPFLTMNPAIVVLIPEPGAFGLVGLGAGVMWISRRRK